MIQKPMIAIIARSHKHAEHMAREMQIPRQQWMDIHVPEQLLSLSMGVVVIRCPEYWRREDSAIIDKLMDARFKQLYGESGQDNPNYVREIAPNPFSEDEGKPKKTTYIKGPR